ncbi:structural maintenance of chromosome 4 [Vigna unguiculata]|uniref:Structural maintenance of chromosome 4 n=1 Tax=Vigna unguiculata TaxID=3917 RepID=A0A4D6N9L9_VIGUN|nr:structural maintenance of chromosome 4 [Vigna unguiculata]
MVFLKIQFYGLILWVERKELDNDMRKCKEEFKEFERQDVNYQKDFKHISQKIKKLEDKLEKDSSKIEALMKKGEESTDLIPKLEDNIPKLQKLLLDEEKILHEITKSSKVWEGSITSLPVLPYYFLRLPMIWTKGHFP